MNAFTAGISSFSSMAIPLVAVALSLMIPIVAIITEHFQKKAKMRLIEKAIEHGANLDDISFEDPACNRPPMPYRGGMVTLAVGFGLLIASQVIDFGSDSFISLVTIGGAITGCVGLALLLNDYMNRDRFKAG